MPSKETNIRWILTIGAALEGVAGLGFLFNSNGSYLLLAADVNQAGEFVARLAGGGLLGLAIACWFGRKTPLEPGGMGAFLGLLIYNVTGCATLIMATLTIAEKPESPAFGAFVHGALSLIQIFILMQRNQSDPKKAT